MFENSNSDSLYKLREDTQVLLKSVLKANKNGWPLKRLDREYKSVVGQSIPFMKFRFHSLKDFLRDIPEIVLIEEDEKHFFKTIVKGTEQEKIRTDVQEFLKSVLNAIPDNVLIEEDKKGTKIAKIKADTEVAKESSCHGE